MEKGSISFFEVEQCGFYKFKENDSSTSILADGSQEETFTSFLKWVENRDFKLTIPWDISDHPKRTQIYCKSIAYDPKVKDFLVVFWKRFGDDSGKVSGISPDAKVGVDVGDSIRIDPKVKGQSAFLGQPMYYWIIPEFNLIATINFTHSCASTKDVCDYIKRCIDYRIENPNKIVTESHSESVKDGRIITTKHVRYKKEGESSSSRFKFFVSTKEINSDKSNAKKLSQLITHIVVRDTISTEKIDKKDSLFTLWDKVNKKKKFSKQIEIIEEVRLSETEVSDILSLYREEYNPLAGWNNIGFKEKNSEAIRWFNRYVTRELIMLPPLAEEQNYYPAEIVLSELMKRRSDLLSQIANGTEEPNAAEM